MQHPSQPCSRFTALAQDRILILPDWWGNVAAELADNAAARALAGMLPSTIEMDGHLRQEKTGGLPNTLPTAPRQRALSTGTLGLWSSAESSSTTAMDAYRRPASRF